jgi:O-antigen/teichoic acid export membrane protein
MANQVPQYRRKVLSSLAWQGSAQLFGQLTSWASTVFVIRLLDPSDYGVMAMATLFVSFVLMLSDLGIGAAIVQAEEVDEDDYAAIQGFVFLFNTAGFAITWLGSHWIAAFFGEERLVPLLDVLSVSFLLLAFYVLPQSRLMRDLEFDKKAKVDFVTLAASAATSLTFALMGFGVWSLVAGTLVTHTVRAIGFNWMCPGSLRPRFSASRGARFLRFGSVVVLDRVLWFLYSNMDITIAGKMLGKEMLGFYSVALTLAAIPLDKVVPVLTQVAFPAVARIQQEPERVQANMLRALRYGNTLFLPVFWGMAWVAADGLPVLLGDKWALAVVPFQLICLILPLKAMAALWPPALFGVGRPAVNVVNMAISLALLSIGFAVGAQSGLRGLAMAWVIVYPVVFAVTGTRAFRVLGIRWRSLARACAPAIAATVAMSLAVYAARWLTADIWVGLRLAAAIGAGGVVYLGAIAALDRESLAEVRGLLAR